MPAKIPRDTRAAAAWVLAQLVKQQGSLASLLPAANANIAAKDQPLLQALCYGACRHWFALQQQAAELLDKPLRNKDADVHALLCIGLLQLRYLRVPDHAAIATVVQATRALKKPWASGLINATLRKAQKQTDIPTLSLDPAAEHPSWLRQAIEQAWPEQADAIFAANQIPAPMTLRVNARQHSVTDYQQLLTTAAITAEPLPNLVRDLCSASLRLAEPVDVEQLPGFSKGSASVQDAHAQLAAPLLDVQPGMRVLDACAAPGGKTAHILEQNDCDVVALDIDAKRVERMQSGLKRLALSANCITADAADVNRWWDQQPFARILVDAPCSATGVLRRHPDIKLTRRAEDIDDLAHRQLALLQALWPCLAPGGKLLYATCSILPQENQQVIEQFLASQADAELATLPTSVELTAPETTIGWQLFPQPLGGDGFYYVLIQKTTAV